MSAENLNRRLLLVALPKSHDLSGSRTAAIRPSSLLPDRSSPPLVRSSPVPIIKPSSIFPPRPIKPIPERKLTTDDRLQTLPNGLTATLSSQQLFIECDGSCIDNGYSTARASIGVNFGRASPYNIAEYVPRSLPQTNQVAELWAAIQAVKKGRVLVRTGHLRGLIIATDSQYVYEGITNWIWNWRRNGFLDFHGKPVKNAGLFRELHGLVEGMEGEGGVVHFVKIRGEINKRADRLATSMHKRNLSHRKGR